MLRVLIALLLLANLGYFAWAQGWLEPIGLRAGGDREPERLQRQVRPEAVRVLPPAAASRAAAAAAPACFEAGPFTDAELGAAQAALQLALPAGSWAAVRTELPGSWIVYMGRYASREALTKKEDELRRRQLPFDEVRDNAALAPGLSLGRFDTPGAANQALERLAQVGVHTARIVELAPPTGRSRLRVDQADAALAARLMALRVDALGKGFVACERTPGG